MSNLVAHAERELALLGGSEDEYQQAINENIIDIVRVFADGGHSGFSAPYTVGLLEKLLRFEPVTPLTGEDDEWNEIGSGVFQNRRCSHVFKEDGEAYDMEGRIFREPDGSCFINRDSRVPVEFPYAPKREYVDRPSER